jgi:predicted permease
MDTLRHDLRDAIRGLLKRPGLVVVCLLSLGLGIGVNLTLFSGLGAIFFDNPTMADADRVVGLEPGNSNQFSYLNYLDLEDSGIFGGVIGHRRTELSFRAGESTRPVSGLAVTGNFFDVLGVRAQIGRTFSKDEAAPGGDPSVVVASHWFWRRHLHSDSNALGQTLNLNGRQYTLIGVLPPQYRAVTPVESPDLYVPVQVLGKTNLSQRGNDNALLVIARLRPGMGVEQARAQLTAFGQRMEQAFPNENQGMKDPAVVFPGRDVRRHRAPGEAPLLAGLLFALFGLVLLVACGNVAGLLMVRGAGRRQEIAVRFALGANRLRIIRALLTESFLLAIAGTALALVFVVWVAPRIFESTIPGLGTSHIELQPGLMLIIFATGLASVTTLICGLVPALRSTRAAIITDIQTGNTRTATGHLRLHHGFVIAQVAISLLLLVIASLFIRSLVRLSAIDPGFNIAHGVVVRVPASAVPPGREVELADRVSDALGRLPVVRSMSAAMLIPLGNDMRGERFTVEGHPERRARTLVNSVGPRYFETMQIPLLQGRDFNRSDRVGAPAVVIVSEGFARAYFPDENPIGRAVDAYTGESASIIGVVKDHFYRGRGGAPEPVLYRAFSQAPNMSTQPRPLIIHVRTARTADSTLPAIRKAMAEFDRSAPVVVTSLAEETSFEITLRKVMGYLLTAVGSLGLLLATIGLYGVMAYVVTAKTAEIAIQMALGASSKLVLWAVLGRGVKLVLIGIGVGTLLALAATRPLAAMLEGMKSNDPVAFVGTAIALTLVGALASYFPARRATRIDPMAALRQQ